MTERPYTNTRTSKDGRWHVVVDTPTVIATPDGAISIAWNGTDEKYRLRAEAVAAEIVDAMNRRALPAADTSALGAVVKPLVWHTYDVWTHWAESTSGTYRVQERNGVWRTSLLLPQTEHIVYEYDADDTTPADFEAARAAAQADYTARILAALEPPTHAAQLAAALALPEVAAMRTAGANWCAVWANR